MVPLEHSESSVVTRYRDSEDHELAIANRWAVAAELLFWLAFLIAVMLLSITAPDFGANVVGMG